MILKVWDLKYLVLKKLVTNKEPDFVLAQLTNWDSFSDEDYSESQDTEYWIRLKKSGITKEIYS